MDFTKRNRLFRTKDDTLRIRGCNGKANIDCEEKVFDIDIGEGNVVLRGFSLEAEVTEFLGRLPF